MNKNLIYLSFGIGWAIGGSELMYWWRRVSAVCVRVVGLRLRLRGGILMWRVTVDESGMMGW